MQDFHLAKRHYDLALETNAEAYLPVILSLGKLYVRSIWHTLTGGKNGLNIWNPEEVEGEFRLRQYARLLVYILSSRSSRGRQGDRWEAKRRKSHGF